MYRSVPRNWIVTGGFCSKPRQLENTHYHDRDKWASHLRKRDTIALWPNSSNVAWLWELWSFELTRTLACGILWTEQLDVGVSDRQSSLLRSFWFKHWSITQMSRNENGEQIRHFINRGFHETNLEVPAVLNFLCFLLSAKVCGTGNELDKE